MAGKSKNRDSGSGEWLSARAAARMLYVTEQAIPKLAARGLIGMRQRLPGVHARYNAADVAALAQRSIVQKSEGND